MRVPLIAFALICGALMWTHSAAAQDDDLAARSFYDAGVAAYGVGRYEAALTAFTQGHELSQRPQFLYNMASCLDRLHRSEQALSMYRRFADAVPGAANIDMVQRRIAFLQAELEAAEVPEAPPLSEDPEESAEETENSEVEGAEVPEGETEETGVEPEEVDLVEANPTATEAGEEQPGRSAFLSVPAMTGFGVGVAGLVTFAVAGAISKGQFSDLESTCAPGCSSDETSASRRNALIADIGLGVGIAGAAFGLIYGLVAGPSDDETQTSVRIEPHRAGANLQVGGAF